MNTMKATAQFTAWLDGLRDMKARNRIVARIDAAAEGHFGDCEPAGEGVSEMRIHYGPGYRLYCAREGATVYLLLIGGDKSSQRRDIIRAKAIWKAFKEGRHES